MDTARERITFSPFVDPGRSVTYDAGTGVAAGERIWLTDSDGRTVEERADPRSSFPTYSADRGWDALQTAYFTSVAVWNYLATPFLFRYPGVSAHEIEPWREDGETWRRLAVRFPPTLPNHNPDQVFYYDDTLYQRRVDYQPAVTGARIAHYTYEPQEFDGLTFYTKRAVYLRDAHGIANKSVAAITLATTSVHTLALLDHPLTARDFDTRP